jgi:putative ABC transport system permease protein
MLQDLRYALRSLVRARSFTAAAVLTLALGIGTTTVVYAVVDALLLRPLPFGDRSGRLVTVHSTHPTQAQDWDDSEVSYPDLLDLRDATTTLAGIEGLLNRNLSLATDRDSERVAGASVTPGLFRLLGESPQLGRDFRDDEGAEPGFESVALISHGIWQRLFAGANDVVGRALPVNGRSVTVIGVMPRGFAFPEQHEVWLPYRMPRDQWRERRNLMAVGLLAPGRTLAEARNELGTLAGSLAERYPASNRGWGAHAIALRELFVGDATRRGLAAMLIAVALVLLVSCANAAGLLLARGIGRSRELSVRAALGAGRARLIRLMLTESVLLALAGGLLAMLLAAWGIELLLRMVGEPMPYWAMVRLDARVAIFASSAALLAAAISGVLPALRLSHVNAVRSDLQGGRTGSTPSQRRLQAALVAGQVALSLTLLVGASLLARSTMALQSADVGFEASPLLSARLYVAGDAYDDVIARAAMIERLVGRLAGIPGVEGAAATGAIPADDGGQGIRLVPAQGSLTVDDYIGAQLVPATPAFFETLGLQLLEGRTFTGDETRRADTDVVIVNRRLAERLWPGDSALGRSVQVATSSAPEIYRVIGVAPDLVYEELGEETEQSQLMMYVPYARAPWRTMALMVRTSGDPRQAAAPLRATVREIDPFFAAYDVQTMTGRRIVTSWGERFLAQTFAAFSVTALLLACVGIYGLTAYTAAERRREVGIRLAIGAQRGDIITLLLRRGVFLALIGCAIGLPLAFAASRMLAGLLFRVSPSDVVVWIVAPAALAGAVLVSSFLPARRASRLDPADAIRE